MGTDWIETPEDLSLVKSTILEVVKKNGTSVLNADDDLTMSIIDRARGNIILFSLNHDNKILNEHIKAGGTVVTIYNRNAVIRNSELDVIICTVDEIPITFGGVVEFNSSNALAAISALHGLGLPIEQIRNGIMTFHPSANQNPGRMNLFDFQTYKVLLDYGHNQESALALADLLPGLSKGRKIALCHGTGSRTDEQIIEYGEALASAYDNILLTDFDPRQRPAGETSQLVHQGLIKAGFKPENIEIIADPEKAVDMLFSKAQTGDLLVIHPDNLEPVMSQIIQRHRQMLEPYTKVE